MGRLRLCHQSTNECESYYRKNFLPDINMLRGLERVVVERGIRGRDYAGDGGTGGYLYRGAGRGSADWDRRIGTIPKYESTGGRAGGGAGIGKGSIQDKGSALGRGAGPVVFRI